MAEDKDFIKKLPKAELHVHLDGSVLPETLYEFSRRYDEFPKFSLEEYANHMHVPESCRDLPEYLATFQFVLPLLQRREVLEKVAFDMVMQADRDNVRYIEVRFSPGLHLHFGLTIDEVIEAVLSGLKQGEEHYGVKTGLIICGIREKDPGFSELLAEKAAEYREMGVVALDLAGDEVHFDALIHKRAFDIVHKKGVHITVHAGEARGADSIKKALFELHAERIGHGIRLKEDPELVEYVRDKRIPLEVCPTSNLHTKTVASISSHPARDYLEAGLLVTINTDNRTASNVDLTHEFELVQKEWNLSRDQVIELAKNGFRAAFLPEDEKEYLIKQFFS